MVVTVSDASAKWTTSRATINWRKKNAMALLAINGPRRDFLVPFWKKTFSAHAKAVIANLPLFVMPKEPKLVRTHTKPPANLARKVLLM